MFRNISHQAEIMNITIDKQALSEESLANLVYDQIVTVADESSCVYYKFPFFKGDIESDTVEAKLLFVSPVYGLFFFDVDSRGDFDDASKERVDNLYNEISSRILKFPLLRQNRGLKYDIRSVVVGNYDYQDGEVYIMCKPEDVARLIKSKKLDVAIPENEYRLMISCIEGTARLVTKKERKNVKPDTKGYILNDIQNHIANFDNKQKEMTMIDVDLPQRIRGLAGSGKTIILAYKAALFHLRYPDSKILYTFFTKSLAETVKGLIRRVYRIYSENQEPNWNNIDVLHGWGGSTMEGVYYNACLENDKPPLTLREARGHGKDAFAYICEQLLKYDIDKKYDMILIDEGQDFPVEFYRLCLRLCRSKRICWAYDDFQNIFEVDIQDEHETFGNDVDGNPLVDLSAHSDLQDIVLEKCYRTPRYVLITAFALGLGIYYKKVLQRLDTVQLWNSLGFLVELGNCETNSHMIISRPEENTPSYSNDQFDASSIKLAKYENIKEECRSIAREITNCVNVEGLLPTDICVICLDMKNIDTYFNEISLHLLNNSINVFNLNNAPYTNTSFFQDGCITLSTVNKAKGNECGYVFICGVDALFNYPDNVVMRDKLFTSMTRTKGWLYLSGYGEGMDMLLDEYQKLKDKNYKLEFDQPDKSETKNIENVSKRRQELDKPMLELLDKFKNTGMSNEEIINYISNNLRKQGDE